MRRCDSVTNQGSTPTSGVGARESARRAAVCLRTGAPPRQAGWGPGREGGGLGTNRPSTLASGVGATEAATPAGRGDSWGPDERERKGKAGGSRGGPSRAPNWRAKGIGFRCRRRPFGGARARLSQQRAPKYPDEATKVSMAPEKTARGPPCCWQSRAAKATEVMIT